MKTIEELERIGDEIVKDYETTAGQKEGTK